MNHGLSKVGQGAEYAPYSWCWETYTSRPTPERFFFSWCASGCL